MATRSETVRRVGKSELYVRQLGIGGGGFANTQAMPDNEVTAVATAAYEGGIRLFDTAPSYGFGVSERRLGVALNNFRRSDVQINSKVGTHLLAAPTHPWPDHDAG